MSLLRRFSTPKTSTAASKIAACAGMGVEVPSCQRPRTKTSSVRRLQRDDVRHNKSFGDTTLEDIFVRYLVTAATCSQHRDFSPHGTAYLRSSRRECRQQSWNQTSKRCFSTRHRTEQTAGAVAQRDFEEPVEISKEEYKDMVNTYGPPPPKPVKSKGIVQGFPLAPRLVIPPEKEDEPPYAPRPIAMVEDEEHLEAMNRFKKRLAKAPGKISLNSFWYSYQRLRTPRLRYLNDREVRRLFSHLTYTEFKHTEGASQRYISVLEECLAENIPIPLNVWNTAISFAGRSLRLGRLRRGNTDEVKSAVEKWMQMEDNGVKGNQVTFNILLDIAVKAGRFALADTLFNEMNLRKMELDRYFHSTMIYYAGMKRDGDGVRRAFNDMVNAGEIIDTSVMNCVILSLIRAGEPAAAEQVFEKMKRLYEAKFGTKGPDGWRGQRELQYTLNHTARGLRMNKQNHENSFFGGTYSSDEKREEVQRASPIAPNARTYRTLIHHHCKTSGNMDRVMELLRENKQNGFHVHGSVYANVFHGFVQHGGYSFTAWNRSLLEMFWQEFLEALSKPDAHFEALDMPDEIKVIKEDDGIDTSSPLAFVESSELSQPSETEEELWLESEEERDNRDVSEEEKAPYFTPVLAIRVIRAFYKCMGHRRMLEVWDQIKREWKDMNADEKEACQAAVDDILRHAL